MDTKEYSSLVLSGGATKCIATIGALHYLYSEKKLEFIENFYGTSAGGLICYFLSIGYTPLELISFLCDSSFLDEFKHLNLKRAIHQKGIIDYYVVYGYLEKLTLNKIGFLPTLLDIKLRFGKSLNLITYNMTESKVEVLNHETYPELSCLTACRMTANVPILFERFFYNSCEYIDGGIVNNFPIFECKSSENVIGIPIVPVEKTKENPNSVVEYLLKIAMIPFIHNRKDYPNNATIIQIDPEISSFDFDLNIGKRLDIFTRGYLTMKDRFPKTIPRKIKLD